MNGCHVPLWISAGALFAQVITMTAPRVAITHTVDRDGIRLSSQHERWRSSLERWALRIDSRQRGPQCKLEPYRQTS